MSPSELLGIAAKSVIRPGLLKNTKTYGRAEELALVPVPGETGQAPDGSPSPVYYIKQAKDGDEAFLAYICDYKEGETNYQVLGKEAPYCFTTTINGCTFSLGMPALDGTLIVSHTNMKSDKMDPEDRVTRGGTSQTDFQAEIATRFHGTGLMVDPTVYWSGGDYVGGRKINITVFGINDGGWKFYYQRWTRDSMSRVNALIDLNAFSTSSRTF
jgi:hypothetical protein